MYTYLIDDDDKIKLMKRQTQTLKLDFDDVTNKWARK